LEKQAQKGELISLYRTFRMSMVSAGLGLIYSKALFGYTVLGELVFHNPA
jgi:hypothetical protein